MTPIDERAHGGYPLADPDGRPVDLAAVQSDDALLDMIGAGHVAHSFTDASLAAVLVAWRRDVDAEPIPVLVGTDMAVALIAGECPVCARKSRVARVVDAILRLLRGRQR